MTDEVAVDETHVQTYMEGLSRLDRVVDDSGYAFTALDVVGKALVNLEPIRNYPHLLFVNLAQNQIADVAPLADLPHLVCANLSENALTAPCVFPHTHLLAVDVSLNQISTLDGFQSSSLSSLKINDNLLTTLSGLSNLPSLRILEASRNAIEDLNALSGESASKLEHLELQENKLTSLSGIESLSALQSLNLQSNQVETFDALEQLSQLTTLGDLVLAGNPVAESEHYRLLLILQLPQLKTLDGFAITDDERLDAVEFKQQRDDEAAAAEAETSED